MNSTLMVMVREGLLAMLPLHILVPLAPLLAAEAPAAPQAALPDLVDRSLAAMHEEKWQEALDLHREAISRFGTDALRIYGPRFGALYYRKGVCEMNLKRWDDALESFRTCYQSFSNDGASTPRENTFQKLALLRWGESAMAAEKWDLALTCFEKFLHERDRQRDTFQKATFYISRAICNYRLGRLADGNENLEIAINNKKEFSTPDAAILAGVQALVTAAIPRKEERMVLDFLRKNRADLTTSPLARWRDSAVYLKLAGDTLTAGMPAAARELYAFVPSSVDALADGDAQLAATPQGPAHDALAAEITSLRAAAAAPESPDIIRLSGIACLHETTGSLRDALDSYQLLETRYPHAARREQHLLSLIRLARQLGETPILRDAVETFLRDFPQSPAAAEVESLVPPGKILK